MLSVLGSPKRACDGIVRRDLLRAGTLGLLGGMTLPQLLRAEQAVAGRDRTTRRRHHVQKGWLQPGKAKSVILLYLFGGPATQDMFDLKPDGPRESRGEFAPISSSVPGFDISEHLPLSARWTSRSAIVRSVHHEAGCHNGIPSLTGFNGTSKSGNPDFESPQDPPSMGSVCDYVGLGDDPQMPTYVHMPNYMGWGRGFYRAGARGGFIGKQFDPLYTVCQPTVEKPAHRDVSQVVCGTPKLPNLNPEISVDRLNLRHSLREQIDNKLREFGGSPAVRAHDKQYQQAFSLLTSSECRKAFDLQAAHPKQRERYGPSLFGESVLIARRLVQAGARFVTACWENYWISNGIAAKSPGDIDYNAWDTHTLNFKLLRELNLPVFDQAYSALMEDLDRTGLLDETLVVVMGEMGRTPKVNKKAGRDHWTHCYSVLFSGAGIRGGTVCGSSDARAAFPASNPVTPADIVSTIYRCLGINPETPVYEPNSRPVPIHHGGKPIEAILA
ncbi:MAG: hypothetical protein CMJ69_15300 [Planctomycetaceae bacterium]|nr:hypothetical protein [Planctomycetaceae bacterium]